MHGTDITRLPKNLEKEKRALSISAECSAEKYVESTAKSNWLALHRLRYKLQNKNSEAHLPGKNEKARSTDGVYKAAE